jgi:hypothetical protein
MAEPTTVTYPPVFIGVTVAFGGQVWTFSGNNPPPELTSRDTAVAIALLNRALEELGASYGG